MAYNKINKLRRDLRVVAIVNANYVPGVGTYAEVWRKFVNPYYPMSYGTFLKIINTPVAALLKKYEQRYGVSGDQDHADNPNQLKLF